MDAGHKVPVSRPALLAAALIVGLLSLAALASHRSDGPRPSTSPSPATQEHAGKPNQARELRLGRPLNVNEATADDLRLLPGIGPKLALRIVEARVRVGHFQDIADLDSVPGIGSKKLRQLAPLITLGASAQSGNNQPADTVNAR